MRALYRRRVKLGREDFIEDLLDHREQPAARPAPHPPVGRGPSPDR